MSLEDDLATLDITIDVSDRSPIYQKLAEQVRQRILSGRLSPGEQLPSSRKLAKLLDISRTSTLNAYNQLIAEGLLITRPSAGIFVSTLTKAIASLHIKASPYERSVIASINTSEVPLGGFDSSSDIELFPVADWSRCMSRVWRRPIL